MDIYRDIVIIVGAVVQIRQSKKIKKKANTFSILSPLEHYYFYYYFFISVET